MKSAIIASTFVLFFLIDKLQGLRIKKLEVPSFAQINSTSAILTCDYEVQEWEKSNGFVLKWYIDSIHIVYQWIPPHMPQVIGTLKGHLTRAYHPSDNLWERSVLRVKNLSTDLSGVYSCTISTYEAEDTDSASMMVWAPASDISLNMFRSSETIVNITCIAHDIIPVPEFRIFVVHPTDNRKRIKLRNQWETKEEGGLYKASGSGILFFYRINSLSSIRCIVFLPGTGYRSIREAKLQSDMPIIYTTTMKPSPDEEAVISANAASSSGISLGINYNWLSWLATHVLYITNAKLFQLYYFL